MGLTDSKITLFGPFDLELLDGITSQYARTGLKDDAVVINMETKVAERELADGKVVRSISGRDILIEIYLSEFDPTATTGDLAKIEGANKLTLDFLEANAASDILTIDGFDKIVAGVDAGRMKISVWYSGDLSKAWSDLVSLA